MSETRERGRIQRGREIANALYLSWRTPPPPVELSSGDISRLISHLVQGAAGPLLWRRLRDTQRLSTSDAAQLRDASRYQILETASAEHAVAAAFARLRAAGLHPILGKGFAIARLYPERGLRHAGDIDLYICGNEYPTARSEADGLGRERFMPIDLHRGFGELDDRPAEELLRRAVSAPLADAEVTMFGPEDHLRLICLHGLKHGLARPTWLCDIAVALEARPASFDWDWFLEGDARRADWIVCAMGLAHELLGARVDDTPLAERAFRLPRWLAPAVLASWAIAYRTPQSIGLMLRRPAPFLSELAMRWPNAVEATVELGAAFDEQPRLPYQLKMFLGRSARFAFQR